MILSRLLPPLLALVCLAPGFAQDPVDVAGSGNEGVLTATGEKTPTAVTTFRRPKARGWRLVPAPGEFRGAWLHWEDYLTPQATARTIARARRARLNALLPLANYPEQAMWQSRIIPVNPQVAPGFDPLRELVRQAHEAGIQVHPYLVMLNAGLSKPPQVEPEWYAHDAHNNRIGGWLNPSYPAVRDFCAALSAEVAETGVDGLHYDYLRHEDGVDADYSDYTRQLFQQQFGWDPLTLRSGGGGNSSPRVRLLQTAFHQNGGSSYFRQEQDFLSATGVGATPVLEGNLGYLTPNTLLIAGNLYSGRVQSATLDRLTGYVERGGVLVVLDGPQVTSDSRRFAEALGLGGTGYFDQKPVRITVLQGPGGCTDGVERVITTRARGNACPSLGDARLLALFDDGTPAVTLKALGKGHILVFNFHVYQGDAAENPGVRKLFSQLVDWLAEQHGLPKSEAGGPDPALWDRWRVEQVGELVHQCTAAARQVRPDLIVSSSAGTRREELTRFRRDGLAWLKAGDVQFLCPMAYTTNNDTFRARLDAELAPVDDPALRSMIFAGLGVYKAPSTAERWVQQVLIAREKGLKGVCFFAFEDLNDQVISALANGPFQEPAPVPWKLESLPF